MKRDPFKYRYMGVLAILACLLATCAVVITPSATAHTPRGNASCEAGVNVSATSYDARDTNTIRIKLDDVEITRTFTSSDSLHLDIPSDGADHYWEWAVSTTNPNPSYSDSDGGNIKCGTPPVVETPTPTPTPSEPPVTEPPVTQPPTPTPPVTEPPVVPPTTPATPAVLHRQLERCLGNALIVTKQYSVDNGKTWKQERVLFFNGHRKCYTPPVEPKKRVRTLEKCIGNALVRYYQRLIGLEWTTFMTRYYEGHEDCVTQPGEPPVQEEGF